MITSICASYDVCVALGHERELQRSSFGRTLRVVFFSNNGSRSIYGYWFHALKGLIWGTLSVHSVSYRDSVAYHTVTHTSYDFAALDFAFSAFDISQHYLINRTIFGDPFSILVGSIRADLVDVSDDRETLRAIEAGYPSLIALCFRNNEI